MKKTYEKPQVYMERFELAEHIATCNFKVNSGDEWSCTATGTLEGDSSTLFADENTSCLDHYEGYCYTSSQAFVSVFNS